MIGKFITVTRKVTTFQDEIHYYEERLFGMDIWIFPDTPGVYNPGKSTHTGVQKDSKVSTK